MSLVLHSFSLIALWTVHLVRTGEVAALVMSFLAMLTDLGMFWDSVLYALRDNEPQPAAAENL